MSFPATYNIQYYMGDTFEFRIFPKDASGAPFPLAQFPTVRFTIAERRGTLLSTDSPRVSGFAEISLDRTNILCSITPQTASFLDPTKRYVYDVEIARPSSPYDQVYTLLTGDITITNQVTQPLPPPAPVVTAPGPIGNLQVSGVTESSISINWSAPTTGSAPLGYKLYLIPYSPELESTLALQALIGQLSTVDSFDETSTSYTFTATTAVPALSLPSMPLMPNTPYVYAVVAFNSAGASTPVGNFNVLAGTVEETFTDSGES
jgi:hypothetical protein